MSVGGWGRQPADGLFRWRGDEPKAWEVAAAFNPRVERMLSESAIPLSEALRRGVRWMAAVTSVTRLRREFGGKGIPPEGDSGLIFPHYALDGQRTLQYRPDQAYIITFSDGSVSKPRKYDWGQSGASGASIGYNAALRIADGTARRLVIVEGTKQALAADIWAPQDVAVVGIQGIWNGQKAGVLLADLATLAPRFCDVVIVPDGDVASNPHVWDGADVLRSLLHAAAPKATVRVAALPAEGKEGLDDLLGRTDEAERTGRVGALLDQAGVMPARPGGVTGLTPPGQRTIWQRFDTVVTAAEVIIALHGGFVTEEGLETAEGVLSVGRFRDGAGFVKATDRTTADALGIPVGKMVTASSILVAAVGGKGAYCILHAHTEAPEDVFAWLEEHSDDLDAGAASLTAESDLRREKAAARREHREIVRAFNTFFTADDLGADPREYPKASDAARAYARRKGADPYGVMEALIEQRLSTR